MSKESHLVLIHAHVEVMKVYLMPEGRHTCLAMPRREVLPGHPVTRCRADIKKQYRFV